MGDNLAGETPVNRRKPDRHPTVCLELERGEAINLGALIAFCTRPPSDGGPDGVAIKEMVRRTGYSRRLIRNVLRGQRSDMFRVRESLLELYLPWLNAQWAAGQRNGVLSGGN